MDADADGALTRAEIETFMDAALSVQRPGLLQSLEDRRASGRLDDAPAPTDAPRP